jgi:hypothetical protein
LIASHISFEMRSRTTRAVSRAARRLERMELGLARSSVVKRIVRSALTGAPP